MSTLTTFFQMLVALASVYSLGESGNGECNSPQYLERGKSGTVNCLFNEDFFAVLWYNTTEYATNDPLVDYHRSSKTGIGYDSGEFDVHTNGSLIINHVSLEHEQTFSVVYLQSEEDAPFVTEIEVVVVVKPSASFPVFDKCGNAINVCYAVVNQPSAECSVGVSKPVIPLYAVVRTVIGDRNITDRSTFKAEGLGFTSRVIIQDVFKFSNILTLLVCKASALPGILENNESFLLAQKGNYSLSSMDVTTKYIDVNTKIALSCTTTNVGFVVWKKTVSLEDPVQELLLYSINLVEGFVNILADDFALGENASLVVETAEVKHQGNYICLYGDGLDDGMKIYEVVIFVNPTPPYPVIQGCNHERYCVLDVEYAGFLTCSLKGIRPNISLEWSAIHEIDETRISFFNHQLTVTDNGETYDVTLISMYRVHHDSRNRLTIECKTPLSVSGPFYLTTKVDLILKKDYELHPTESVGFSNTVPSFVWIISAILCLFFLILAVVAVVVIKHIWTGSGNRMTEEGDSTEMSLMSKENGNNGNRLSGLKDQFLKQVKEKYRDLYDSVQPIPYVKDRLYCVDKVFVEGGFEFLDLVGGVGGRYLWKRLESYGEIFDAAEVSSSRRILEGEPGYGKSTVTLQFAYDWCNRTPTSALRDVEILILLRLRQLGGVPSIYKGIKRFILPKDSTISETDIEHILHNSKSVVVILDGYDEYPDQDSTTITDVIAIIKRQMFQDFEVVTTTRSSCLPKKYPALTKLIRLTGFDEKARKYYIRKAVVGDDDGVRKVEEYLEDNPILSDLCQVPLLFVIFAHMTHESEQFCKLNSVTSFFRYMISCFHSHMRNKMDDENVCEYEMFETNHHDLDKLAFEASTGKCRKIVWTKDEICKAVGQEFYDQYIRIGILVEEESVDIIDDPGTPITEHVQYKTEVRFYHKLFCEWYAAHYLADYLQQNPSTNLTDFLRNLDPFDVQYLYRFACGINSDSATKIINFLNNIEGGNKFAILCILEKTGKIDSIEKVIRHLCDEGVVISIHDSLLLQRSSMQLLEIAARNEIPIKYVNLNDCFLSVEQSGAAIMTTSGLIFTSRIPVEKLAVTLYNKEMTDSEATDILEFSSKCTSLRHLRFGGSVPPFVVWNESVLSALESNKTKVFWRLDKEESWYVLNLQTGRWENELSRKEANYEKFQRLRLKFRQEMLAGSEDFHKTEIKEMRERLSPKASSLTNFKKRQCLSSNENFTRILIDRERNMTNRLKTV